MYIYIYMYIEREVRPRELRRFSMALTLFYKRPGTHIFCLHAHAHIYVYWHIHVYRERTWAA